VPSPGSKPKAPNHCANPSLAAALQDLLTLAERIAPAANAYCA